MREIWPLTFYPADVLRVKLLNEANQRLQHAETSGNQGQAEDVFHPTC